AGAVVMLVTLSQGGPYAAHLGIGLPCQNELTWRTGAHRKPRAGWQRTAWTSDGSPLTTVTPPRTTRWPSTWRPGGRPRPAGCTTTWPRAPHSSTGPLPARSGAA